MCTYIDHCNLRELSQGHIHLNSLGHFEILFYGKGEDGGNFAYQRGISSLIGPRLKTEGIYRITLVGAWVRG